MRARAIVGKTIRRVHQGFAQMNSGKAWVIHAIEFTDGSFLQFNVLEGEGEYAIEPIYPARGVAEDSSHV